MTYGNGQGQPREPVDQIVDLFVHMPIGLAVMAWKRFPELVSAMPELVGQMVSKGCAQLSEAEEKITGEVRKARMIGQFAVTFGGRQLRREVDSRLRDVRRAAGGDRGGAPVSTTDTPAQPASPPEPAPAASAAKAAPARPAATKRPPRAKPATAAPTRPATPSGTGRAKASGAAKAKPSGAAKPKAPGAGKAKAPGTAKAKAPGASKAKAPGAARAKAPGASQAKAPGAAKARAPGASQATAPGASQAKASGAGKAKAAGGTPGLASAADLPIREYDGLSASQVVSRLTGLTPAELQAVRSYEERSRDRRTILLAIDRLLG